MYAVPQKNFTQCFYCLVISVFNNLDAVFSTFELYIIRRIPYMRALYITCMLLVIHVDMTARMCIKTLYTNAHHREYLFIVTLKNNNQHWYCTTIVLHFTIFIFFSSVVQTHSHHFTCRSMGVEVYISLLLPYIVSSCE